MNLQTPCHVRAFTLKATCLALLAAGLLACERAQAQDSPEMTATYGRGVHAYFDNQTNLAEEYFSQVIRTGSTDPRAYYYRAMNRMRNGQQQEAEEDMRIGAAHEASNPGNRHAIGKALERVQGPHRRLLERFRQQARMDRLQQRRQQTRRRYEQLQQREPAVLRREIPVPLEQLVEPSLDLPAQLGTPSASPLPGFAVPAAEGIAPVEAAPTPSPEPDSSPEIDQDDPFTEGPSNDDIFGEPEPRAEPTDQDDPFGGPAEPTEETDPAPMEDDPFGEPEPDQQDEEPAQEEDDPFATTTPSADSQEGSSALFGETAPETGSSTDQLQPSDQVESSQMVGILGRVVGSLFPWRNLEIPSMGPEPGADVQQAGGVEFGPFDEQPEVIQVSTEEPIAEDADSENLFGEAADDSASEPVDDLFGEPTDDPFDVGDTDEEPADDPFDVGDTDEEPADDPFDVGATDEEPAPATEATEDESSESEESEPDFDDPFGEF